MQAGAWSSEAESRRWLPGGSQTRPYEERIDVPAGICVIARDEDPPVAKGARQMEHPENQKPNLEPGGAAQREWTAS